MSIKKLNNMLQVIGVGGNVKTLGFGCLERFPQSWGNGLVFKKIKVILRGGLQLFPKIWGNMK